MADTCTSTCYNNHNNNDHDQEQQEQHPIFKSSMSAPLYELQDVFDQYKSHPELLRLILSSKVEEDKRRTEEAKLRSRELDYYLKNDSVPPPPPSQNVNLPTAIVSSFQQPKMPTTSPGNGNNNKRRLDPSAPYLFHRYHHRHRRHIKATKGPMTPDSKHSIDHQQQRRQSAANAMLAMGSSVTPTLLLDKARHMYSDGGDEERDASTTTNSNADASPVTEDHTMDQDEGKPRRRREMLTKIVETRDFPYMDNFFWRNNGNTTQKRTGCRSIYYKCSNSSKGCQVNKTVTAKQNGVYLIKYRGNHMVECGMVERICDL